MRAKVVSKVHLPLGTPTSSPRAAIARAESGVSSAGLITQVHPVENKLIHSR